MCLEHRRKNGQIFFFISSWKFWSKLFFLSFNSIPQKLNGKVSAGYQETFLVNCVLFSMSFWKIQVAWTFLLKYFFLLLLELLWKYFSSDFVQGLKARVRFLFSFSCYPRETIHLFNEATVTTAVQLIEKGSGRKWPEVVTNMYMYNNKQRALSSFDGEEIRGGKFERETIYRFKENASNKKFDLLECPKFSSHRFTLKPSTRSFLTIWVLR